MLGILTVVTLLGVCQAQFEPGNNVAVHLFEWSWEAIADECENWLAPFGYGAVQISPPSENSRVEDPYRPWWERYQPVSYILESPSGSRDMLASMISRCNAVGVQIYADLVINHMTGSYDGVGVNGNGFSGSGSDPSYPAVPYGGADFNHHGVECHSSDGSIQDYGNAEQVRNCELVGLNDLRLGTDYVRGMVRAYMDDLIGLGVSGFRVDASKHMWPGDLEAIFSGLGEFIYMEVIDLNPGSEGVTASEYLHIGRVTEFRYSAQIGNVFRYQALSNLNNWGEGWGFWTSTSAVVFVDNHDNQRGHGAGGADIINYKDPYLYKLANAFMLAHPYGYTRVMSSFYFDNSDQGPPKNGDINAYPGCDTEWACEHRWRQIRNMVVFRNEVAGTDMSDWWDNGGSQIAFARTGKGFFVMNKENYDLSVNLQTSLSPGTYCDGISGEYLDCDGTLITVADDGTADFFISGSSSDPVIAIHIGAMLT